VTCCRCLGCETLAFVESSRVGFLGVWIHNGDCTLGPMGRDWRLLLGASTYNRAYCESQGKGSSRVTPPLPDGSSGGSRSRSGSGSPICFRFRWRYRSRYRHVRQRRTTGFPLRCSWLPSLRDVFMPEAWERVWHRWDEAITQGDEDVAAPSCHVLGSGV
jgi:hypothetical protein